MPATRTDDPDGEWRRLQQAIVTARGEVQRTRARVARKVGATEAAIFDAHLLLLEDTDLLGEVRALLDDGLAAAPAWAQTINRISDEIAALPDEYLRTRAQDVCAVGDQVIQALIGGHTGTLGAAGVVVAPDMTPAEAADLDQRQVAAVLLAFGSPTSHSTILLRAKGIPAVVAAGPAVLDIAHGTSTAVDGTRGEFVVNPSTDVRAAWQARAADLARREQRALTGADSPAATRDGIDILVGANIGSLDDAHSASTTGADLAGLVRTEFLFLNRAQAPTVDEQETVYRDIAKALDGRRITLRTLDVGGDKPLDYLPLPFEANPFLGVRGIRLSLAHPRLFADQLLAIVRVAHNTPVSLMFPMISTLDELIRAQTVLDDAISVDGRGRPDDLRVGIMVEVPAAALKAAVFTPHIDFLSIGTNDLTQYTLAAERGNAAVADTCDPLDPAVLRLIDVACRGAAGRVPVAVCGELAAAELVTPLLLGLGVRQLSVAPRAVPTIKHAARAVDITETAELVTQSIHLESAAAVRRLLDAAPARPCWLI